MNEIDPRDLLMLAVVYQTRALENAGTPEGDADLMHAKRYRLCAKEILELRTKVEKTENREPIAWMFTDNCGTHFTDDPRDWMAAAGIETVTPLVAKES